MCYKVCLVHGHGFTRGLTAGNKTLVTYTLGAARRSGHRTNYLAARIYRHKNFGICAAFTSALNGTNCRDCSQTLQRAEAATAENYIAVRRANGG
jgi:hypothetical protein